MAQSVAEAPWLLRSGSIQTLDAYEVAGGGGGLRRARTMVREEVIETVEDSGLRGRGGAGFPTGAKWRTVRDAGESSRPPEALLADFDTEAGRFVYAGPHYYRVDDRPDEPRWEVPGEAVDGA